MHIKDDNDYYNNSMQISIGNNVKATPTTCTVAVIALLW